MSVIERILDSLGLGGAARPSEEIGVDLAELTLETRVPEGDNAIHQRFESIEISLRSLTLESADGDTQSLSLAGTFDLCEPKQIEGSTAVYKLRVPPATYERGTFSLIVREFELASDAPEYELEGFEEGTLDFGDRQFEPVGGEDWLVTLVLVAREDADEAAYVLTPQLEWRPETY